MKKHLLTATVLILLIIAVSTTTSIGKRSEGLTSFFSERVFKDSTKANDSVEVTRASYAHHMEGWKQWKTVENFTYGKNRGNLPMIADLQSLHPYFRDKIVQLIKNCKAKGIELAIVESYRTHAKQSEYYGMGKKYTRSAGGKSKHQYGLAVDVVPVIDSVAVWDNILLWKKVGMEGEKLGLRWGGRWRSPYDPAHFEWSGGMTSYQLAQGVMPLLPQTTSQFYPCIEEDIKQLKSYWEAWEREQAALLANLSASSSMVSRQNR
ncbi:M15 family metallopeptidase [Chryseosolibacter indicus]|uniref:M15 family metallopeptidase n=1 Tax=Chryseosolibacter indicus TaxID=2782351 RepID=A0ABS5VXX0_9BACT|nr:M15 family metallopeptidase [Chryseosolibacter indicus]MBT1706258.1 M15 family metallopeptidase [Chryseosolibacter indicus]